MENNNRIRLWLACCAMLAPFPARAAATITIVNGDAANVGFNDSTVVSPIGGNPGTTIGQQRMNVFTAAASKWGSILNSPVEIRVRATWTALTCSASSAVLGSAGAGSVWRDFANAPVANRWYPKALSNKLSGSDMNSSSADINANFNVNLGQPGCLTGLFFYLGLDGNHGSSIDFFTVLLHEMGHGLGFATFTNGSSGSFISGYPSVWDDFLLDNTTNKTWAQMSAAERVASAINNGHLVWTGANVAAALPQVLQSGADTMGRALMYAPGSFQSGSSISHFDTTMAPNQIMEPALNSNLGHEVTPPSDLTYSLLRDIGWGAGAVQFPNLSITKSHTGNFTPGQVGAVYRILVTNSGNAATSGVVSASDTLPSGLTATAMSGSGWTCSLATLICTRSDALAAGSSYPLVTLTVNVANNIPSQITNRADAWGGGSVPATTNDITAIQGACSFSLSPATTGAVFVGKQGSTGINAGSGCNWSATSNAAWITIVSGGSGTGNGTLNYSVAANSGAAARTGTVSVAGQTFTVNQAGRVAGKAGILRPSANMIAEDVNGNLGWDGADRAIAFGIPGDKVVFGDWNGSGTTKMGIYRPSNGLWALDVNGNGIWEYGVDSVGVFGSPGDMPIVGDWTGDGKTKIGIYRPSVGMFALDTNNNLAWDGGVDKYGVFGVPGDTPILGDWTGDGKTKIGIYRSSTALFALDMNGNLGWDSGSDKAGVFGAPGDTPIIGDWTGDGIAKIGIHRDPVALWALDLNNNISWDSGIDKAGVFGSAGDQWVIGDWDGTGVSRAGIFRPSNGLWGLDKNGNLAWDTATDQAGVFGAFGDTPFVGKW